jgi:hypothetical protein
VAITNQSFNRTAHSQAELNHVELLNGEDLIAIMTEHPVTHGELAKFLMMEW